MNSSISTTAELITELRSVDGPAAHMGAANWIVELIADRIDDFDSPDAFVDLWLEADDLPDDQMGWILSNGFGPEWQIPLLERLGQAVDAGDTTTTPPLLDHLRIAGQQAGQDLVILGASGGGTPPPRDLIDIDPPTRSANGDSSGLELEAHDTTHPDDLDPRRFQVSRDADDADVVDFEFSERVDLQILAVVGDDTLLAELIPEGGLQTRWVVSSAQPIASVDTDTSVYPFVGDTTERWIAEFDLLIPKIGDSDVRKLRCDGDDQQTLEVRIYVNGASTDLLRRLTVSLGANATELDIDDDAAGDLRDSIDPPHHEFTTPPDELLLTVADDVAFIKHGSAPRDTTLWPSAAELSGPIATLRQKADTFRSTHGAQLDDIDADELAARITHDLDTQYLGRTVDWQFGTYDDIDVNSTHQAAWDTIAASNEALDLAFYGYALYNTFFPEGTPLRTALDTMPAGSRISIDWPVEAGNASVPWNLMYTDPPPTSGPIDAERFFGLRFRFSWSKWRRAPASQVLGKATEAERLHLLYWKDDEIGTEADHQRAQAGTYPTHRVVPENADPDTNPARQQAIDELAAPTAAAILHFYCHCAHDTAAKETKLIFGPIQQQADFKLSGRDFGAGRFTGEPLVFVNACESAGADAYEVNQLEQMFFRRGCRAFMGTEIRVPIALAARFAHIFFALFETPLDDGRLFAGEAAAHARRYLWLNYRNIGGLFYSYIHHYGLRMEP